MTTGRRTMTLYILLVGLGIIIYTGAAYMAGVVAGSQGETAVGLPFSLALFLVFGVASLCAALVRRTSLPRAHHASVLMTRTFWTAVTLLAAGAILVASTRTS